jgi:hypothetical protein
MEKNINFGNSTGGSTEGAKLPCALSFSTARREK